MKPAEKKISVTEAAKLCNVARSTINYWIRTKRIQADRSGKKYTIPVNELLLMLKSKGKPLPEALKDIETQEPVFRRMIPCWKFWKDTRHGLKCKDCVVSENELLTCFSAKESSKFGCRNECANCQYYQEIYLPRIRFLYQIGYPAAVIKDLQFWGCNHKWAELCGVSTNELPGMGIEQVIHTDSLEKMISNIKKINLGEPVSVSIDIFLKNRLRGKIVASVSFMPLIEPVGVLITGLNK